MQSKFKIILIVISLILPLAVSVCEVQADSKWYVLSEYTSQIPGQLPTTVLWKFDRQSLESGGFKWKVQDSNEVVRCRAEFYFNVSGALEQADCYRKVQKDEICDARQYVVSRPALLNQTLIPGDWLNRSLPFVFEAGKRDMVLYEQIGTSRFANYIEIQDRRISRDEAFAKGLLRADLQFDLPASAELGLVEVRRVVDGDASDLLLQQLWLAGDNFWLYESKSGRRSWRVLQK